jgi:hypothetical protein
MGKAVPEKGRGYSHIFYIAGPQMVVRLSALSAGLPLPPERFPVLISVTASVDPGAII